MSSTESSTSVGGLVRGLQIAAVLTVLSLAFQFVTAGQLLPDGGSDTLHAGGAVALHLFSGLTTVAAVLLWRRSAVPAALAGLAGAVFVLTFAQAAVGGRSTLWIHIPGAMVVTTGAVWVAVWALTRANRT
ncbi:MAG: hypothetical protein H0T66_13000 [Geodermatophilaceae bacterium]|nr:hypothetical protein [Geodermatophilaceae bacterium]MDQ3456512.1 hypothetical protein [Actinomycetota bacterium]